MIPLARTTSPYIVYFLNSIGNSERFQRCLAASQRGLTFLSGRSEAMQTFLLGRIEQLEQNWGSRLPGFEFQTTMDQIGERALTETDSLRDYLRDRLGIADFKQWLEENNKETWYEQLDIYLCKLPLHIAYDVICLMRLLIEATCSTAAHPSPAFFSLAKNLVSLAHSFSNPETWALFGAGLVSSSAGRSFMTGTPLFALGATIGSVFLIAGITGCAIQGSAKDGESKLESAQLAVQELLRKLPKPAAESFLMGLVAGKIQSSSRPKHPPYYFIQGRPICVVFRGRRG